MSEHFDEQQLEIWKLDRQRDKAEAAISDIDVIDKAFRDEVGRRKRLMERFIQSTKDRKEEILLNASIFKGGIADVSPSPETLEVMNHPTRGLTHAL